MNRNKKESKMAKDIEQEDDGEEDKWVDEEDAADAKDSDEPDNDDDDDADDEGW